MQTPEQAFFRRAAAELTGAELHALADDVLRALARLEAAERVIAVVRDALAAYDALEADRG